MCAMGCGNGPCYGNGPCCVPWGVPSTVPSCTGCGGFAVRHGGRALEPVAVCGAWHGVAGYDVAVCGDVDVVLEPHAIGAWHGVAMCGALRGW